MSEKINVLGIDETLDYVLKNGSSVARFGDGETDLISGRSIPYQDYDVELGAELRNILESQSNEQLVVCMPDVFSCLSRYNKFANDFWKEHLDKYHDLYEIIKWCKWYGSTFISRPYIDLEDKSYSARYFKHLKQLWNHRDILIVEGNTSRSGVGNDLFDNASSIERIICPSKNAYFFLEEIENAIRKYSDDKLVIVMLGPCAKLVAYHLSLENRRIIDIGHIDSEYEWFKMGTQAKMQITGKHIAEFNYVDDQIDIEDPNYRSQIVCKINNFPKISIIIYVDEGTSQIENTLLSIVDQSYTNIDIVVVANDASYGTMKTCERTSSQDDRLNCTYVNIDDTGQGYNIALNTIRGELITFVHQNDRIR